MDNRQGRRVPLCTQYPFTLQNGIRRKKELCRVFEREKKTDCGNYREVDIIPRTDNAEKAESNGAKAKRPEP